MTLPSPPLLRAATALAAALVLGGACARPAAAAGTPLAAQLSECWKVAAERPEEALRFAEAELARIPPPAGDRALAVDRAELALCRGYALEQLGRIEPAETLYRETVDAAERLGDQKLLASALVLRGELAYYRGAFTAALEDLDRAHRLEVELGRPKQGRYALNAIANLYSDSRVGAYDQAIEYYRQLLAAHEAEANLPEVATTRFNLGSTFERKGDFEAALAEFEQALALDRARGDLDEAAYDERAAAAVQVKLGRVKEALPRLDRVLARFAASGDAESLARARLSRGIARRALGELDGALADFEAALDHFRRTDNFRFLEKVEAERAELFAARTDFASAFAARSAELELERRLAETTRDEHTSRLRVQFDSEKKEAENRALARENEASARALADAARIRTLQWAVLALAALLLVLLGALAARQLARARRLHLLAMTDELTRLPNRRAFFTLAREKLEEAKRSGAPLALLALDVDYFKRINDTQGHETGDRVLQRVAAAARGALRGGDAVGRTGGEEFLALLPETAAAAAAEVAERLRAAVEAIDAADLAPGLRVTVSVGAAERAAADATVEALVRRADEALYRAKQNGRNRVELAPGQP